MDDWPRFTWSLGWTGNRLPTLPPASWIARLAITSLAFMFVDVPLPVWKTSTTNWSSCVPAATSSAARSTHAAMGSPSRPRSRFTAAAAALICPSAWITPEGICQPLTGKLSCARRVCAPYRAPSGTSIDPMLSRSVLIPALLARPARGSNRALQKLVTPNYLSSERRVRGQAPRSRESRKICAGCRAVRPVPSWIWCLQLVPGAAMIVSSSAARTAGKRTCSPMAIERS